MPAAPLLLSFFFSSRRRHTRWPRDWSSDVCSSDLPDTETQEEILMSPTLPLSSARFSRRAGFTLAATGAAGGAAALLGAGSAPAAATAPAGHGGRGPRPGHSALIPVSAATVWVEPQLDRPGIDDPSLGNPVDLDAWNANMEDTETRQWLTGKLETQGVLGSRVLVDEIDGDWAK